MVRNLHTVQAPALGCSPLVSMDAATKHLPPAYGPGSGTTRLHHWTLLREPCTPRVPGSRLMELGQIRGQDPVELPRLQNAELVETFRTHQPHPALSAGMRLRGLRGRADDRNALSREQHVAGRGNLGVPTVDQASALALPDPGSPTCAGGPHPAGTR